VKCQAIAAGQGQHAVALMCRVLGVRRSTYYAWRRRPLRARCQADRRLLTHIRVIHGESDRTYGSPRVYRELRERGMVCGRHRVARLMRSVGLRAKQANRRPRQRTVAARAPAAPNLLQRRFQATAPNVVWVSDLTYIPTREGWLYLAVVLDLYSRRVVGWAVDRRMSQDVAVAALDAAIGTRRPPPGLLHHSDRGSQYRNPVYQAQLAAHGFRSSMSRAATCADNAVVESFFHTLKTERVHGTHYQTRAEARSDVFEFIECWYNPRRRHSTLDYLSPAAFERAHGT
jgi:putative transposase